EAYTAHDVGLLQSIRKQRGGGIFSAKFFGTALFVSTLLLLVHSFGLRYIRKYAPQRIDRYFLGTMLVMMVGLLRAGGFLIDALAQTLPLTIPRGAYSYLLPLAAGGMFVRFLLNSETAILFSVVAAVLTGMMFTADPAYTAFAFTANVAGAMAIAHADRRSAIIKAGLLASALIAIAIVGLQLARIGLPGEVLTWRGIAWSIGMAAAGTMIAAIFVLALTPLFEWMFGYTTDIKLLELANLNHPLLRELVIRAPGTYHHSHLVGILAEAAAQAIGANPLLARVGAYYHDIGKIRKPLYFTENLKEGESRHDRLTPHMSALIISSHVKDGVELARSYQLPPKIVDMIPQHHGTNRIGYFFERAKAQEDPTLGTVEEKDYRYPGPKPQTREAGILMLSDQTEGAVRALREKSPTRIQQTSEQIINKCFADGQLDECELTLKNLNEIAKAFVRILLGIYHQRTEYPRDTLKLHEKDVAVLEGESGRQDPLLSGKISSPSFRH
ncbi:MAG: HDIG domain-containing protein, partial [Deltaproteobacteria bacterium]|nr:HDIG domain-containing protein [Deltaproteobacteria bacterium]